MSPAEDVSSWLPEARAKLGMTQEQLGRSLDVAPNTIARWERGERLVQSPAMLRLALKALEPTLRDRPRSSGACPPAD